MKETVCKSSEKSRKGRKHVRFINAGYSYKEKEKQNAGSYLSGAYWVFNTIKYSYIVVSICS